MISVDLPEKLTKLRKNMNISQSKLGQYIGVSAQAIAKWENAICSPSTENLIKLAEFFGVPLNHFFEEQKKSASFKTAAGMESLKELYKTGRGPSSSHTMGPEKACILFREKYADADYFRVTLYGSLAKTGKGHGTDRVIKKTFSPVDCDIEFNYMKNDSMHPNTMDIYAYKGEKNIGYARVCSIGGGKIVFENAIDEQAKNVYSLCTFESIASYCKENNLRLWQFAEAHEDKDFRGYMGEIWSAMKSAIKNGLEDEGILPGGLEVQKKAKYLYNLQHIDESSETRENSLFVLMHLR